jgi:alpha-L-fucosidase
MKTPIASSLISFSLATAFLFAAPGIEDVADPMSASKPIENWRKGETKQQRDERMAWWREAKFGMFIHWGLYSIPGGVWKGKKYNSEWIYAHASIPSDEYRQLARQFNPVHFDADAWVKLAKDSGQKYIVITTKHHDGFALFPTRFSNFNLKDCTGFKRDPLAELAAACRKHGIRLGFYYSQGQDWTNPGGGFVSSAKGPWDTSQMGDFDTYFNGVAIPQIRELLTQYGPDVPALLWFDTPSGNMTPERVERLLPLLQERPGLIINNRLRYGGPGDFSTPESYIPPRGFVDRDWEAAMQMNKHWGYSGNDQAWKSSTTLIRQLVDAVSKGGNYLLNIGPRPDGTIPEASVERLLEIGQWMAVNGEAIYGCQPTRFGPEAGTPDPTRKDRKGNPVFTAKWDWCCTTKPGKIFLHLIKWPTLGEFVAPPIVEKVKKAYFLADPSHAPLPITQTTNGVRIPIPEKPIDPKVSVICLELE